MPWHDLEVDRKERYLTVAGGVMAHDGGLPVRRRVLGLVLTRRLEMPKDIGKLTRHSPIKPQGRGARGGEYQADKLELTAKSCKPSKSSTHKQAMIDGPYGGKRKA